MWDKAVGVIAEAFSVDPFELHGSIRYPTIVPVGKAVRFAACGGADAYYLHEGRQTVNDRFTGRACVARRQYEYTLETQLRECLSGRE